MMQIRLLGTGNAAGFPVYGCDCEYCIAAKSRPEQYRTPCSALIQIEAKQYLLDAGQVDLHRRFPAGSMSAILLTHFHPDHVQGLFHLRWGKNLNIPVFTPPDSNGCADLYKHPGILNFLPQRKYQSFDLDSLKVTPLPLIHSKPTFGYLLSYNEKHVAYLTDTKGLPEGTVHSLQSVELDTMIIDCSFVPGFQGKGHNNLDDIIEIQKLICARRVLLTHIGHDLDIWLRKNTLPDGIEAAYDNMLLEF